MRPTKHAQYATQYFTLDSVLVSDRMYSQGQIDAKLKVAHEVPRVEVLDYDPPGRPSDYRRRSSAKH